MKFSYFPLYKQLDQMDCGPSCLRMIAKFYGAKYSLLEIRERMKITREGVSLLSISEVAESVGFKTIGARLSFEKLAEEVILPCIVHWNRIHFVVVYKIHNNKVYVADPAIGLVRYTSEEFKKSWIPIDDPTAFGLVLVVYKVHISVSRGTNSW